LKFKKNFKQLIKIFRFKLFGATEVLITFMKENKIKRNSFSIIKLLFSFYENIWESFSVDNDYGLDFLEFRKSI
jgi:hypothetical protein